MATKDILKDLRKEKNLSAQQVADGCEMSLGVYKKYESGERGVGTPALLKFADFYGVSTDYLLGRSDERPDPIEQITDEELEQEMLRMYFELPNNVREEFRKLLLQAVERSELRKRQNSFTSEKAIARSSENDYLDIPTAETEEAFEEVKSDPDF